MRAGILQYIFYTKVKEGEDFRVVLSVCKNKMNFYQNVFELFSLNIKFSIILIAFYVNNFIFSGFFFKQQIPIPIKSFRRFELICQFAILFTSTFGSILTADKIKTK